MGQQIKRANDRSYLLVRIIVDVGLDAVLLLEEDGGV